MTTSEPKCLFEDRAWWDSLAPCPWCRGSGAVTVLVPWAAGTPYPNGVLSVLTGRSCPACGGSGWAPQQQEEEEA